MSRANDRKFYGKSDFEWKLCSKTQTFKQEKFHLNFKIHLVKDSIRQWDDPSCWNISDMSRIRLKSNQLHKQFFFHCVSIWFTNIFLHQKTVKKFWYFFKYPKGKLNLKIHVYAYIWGIFVSRIVCL